MTKKNENKTSKNETTNNINENNKYVFVFF